MIGVGVTATACFGPVRLADADLERAALERCDSGGGEERPGRKMIRTGRVA